ncbi:MAG: M23 family metallopeptidase [Reichenbachiella sp.]
MKLNNILVILFLAIIFPAVGQKAPSRGDFMFPIRPQQENYLSGTMGELRSTHFHSGIDIKTSGITGLPVYATAGGYIQRIRVSLGGYGNCLYVFHPETNTISVYAHLTSFDPVIAEYVREQQYKKKSFEVNLFPKKDQFVFQKGDIIGKSGNSGSSSGPHLHFEIRDKDHTILDPLAFGFDEIIDNIAPTISKIAFVALSDDARINGVFGRYEFDVNLDEQGNAVIDSPLSLFGDIGVEVYAYDQCDGARNKNGIPRQVVTLDNDLVFSQDINSMEFSLQRNILVHTNYKRSTQGGRRFNRYYVVEGNDLGQFYQTNEFDGVLRIYDKELHDLDIRLEDSYGNASQFNLKINKDNTADIKAFQQLASSKKKEVNLHANFLEVRGDMTGYSYCEAIFYIDSSAVSIQLAYDVLDQGYYIYDMNWGIPDSAIICDDTLQFNYEERIVSGVRNDWIGENIVMSFTDRSMFSDIYLKYDYLNDSLTEQFKIGNREDALRQFIAIDLMPQLSYDYDKAAVYSVIKPGKYSYYGGDWENGLITFKTRELQVYTILEDTTKPRITKKKSYAGSAKFRLTDDLSGVGKVEAYLNDKWIMMNHDAKSGTVWTDRKIVLSGSFVLKVSDNAQNLSEFKAEY